MTALKLEKYDYSSIEFATNGVANEEAADLSKTFAARPPKQPVNYAQMRKDIKIRFSKTLAHLAK